GVVQIVRQGEGLLHFIYGLIWKTNNCANQRIADIGTDTGIMATVLKCLVAMSFAPIKGKSASYMLMCLCKGTRYQKRAPRRMMCLQFQHVVLSIVSNTEKFLD